MQTIKTFIFAILLFSASPVKATSWFNIINTSEVYKALASGSLESINGQIEKLQSSTSDLAEAYEGALLMKKSGLMKAPAKEKIAVFKSGKQKLESVIARDPNNVEYHFLRLIIQENAPKIVKYNKDVKEDAALIKSEFKNLPANLQQVITDYSKKSKGLKLT
jgi:hypothetical protein